MKHRSLRWTKTNEKNYLRFTESVHHVVKKTFKITALISFGLSVGGYQYIFRSVPLYTLPFSKAQQIQIEEVKPDIVIHKSSRRLFLAKEGVLQKNKDTSYTSWKIVLGNSPLGDKSKEGDEKTPEGIYRFTDYAPKSSYHGSLLIHYPNLEDAQRGKKAGIISRNIYKKIVSAQKNSIAPAQKTPMGGFILIHGTTTKLPQNIKARHLKTNGCVGLRNTDIFSLRTKLPSTSGTILILP